PYNVAAPGRAPIMGKRHPYQVFLARVREKLLGLGFRELTGPTIETQFWNFDALFQPQAHPARDWTDVYSVREPVAGDLPDPKLVARVRQAHERGVAGSSGLQRPWSPEKAALLMPRAHDTAITPRGLAGLCGKIEIPGKYFQIVRCYRPDVIDATHGVEFNQLGGFVLGEGITLRHLLGLLKTLVYEIAGLHGAKVRFLTDYYPFTEPSVQISVKHQTKGWMELAGAGLFREEMVKPLGIDVPVIAWGAGLDRLAMMALNISDIRTLFAPDLSWLREKPIFQELKI
ncbi:MAG TPA: phenylalanine--tRNA ligase subunit alpha, partial [archaeon]|nr:phenylalanine--tRNA ligase subunit alpha [archaeon]